MITISRLTEKYIIYYTSINKFITASSQYSPNKGGEKVMKKAMAFILISTMVLGLMTGCGSTGNNSGSSNSNSGSSAAENVTTADSKDAAEAEASIVSSDTRILDNGRYDQIIVALGSDPADLLPARPMGIKSYFFWNIYETLFDYDEDMNFVSNLAKGYTIVSDTEWHFDIFETIYDSEGNHITADDVVYSYNWVVESGNAIKYSMFDSIERVDDYTVAIHWKSEPTSLAALEFILARTYIFSQTAFEKHNFSSEPVATGCYVVSKYTSGSELTLEANDNYWALNTDEDVSMRLPVHNANVQTLVFQIITESSQAGVALEMGNVDFCDYVQTTMMSKFKEGGEHADQFQTIECLTSDYYFLAPNMSSAIFNDDLNLRLAIYYALDNPSIAVAMGADYTPLKYLGHSYYYDFNTDWENEDTYTTNYSIELAKEYLAASNYNGEEIVMIGRSEEASKNALTLIQTFLAQIGINVKIQALENTIMQATYAEQTGWDMMLSSVGGSSLVGSWSKLLDNNVNNGYTTCWLADDTLQSLYKTALNDATHDDEHIKECIDYVFSIGAVYPVAVMSYTIVCTNDITEMYFQESYPMVGASNYVGQ